MHGILKNVHLGRTKYNKTKQMASKIENTEEKKVTYIDLKKLCIKSFFSSFEESKVTRVVQSTVHT